MIVGRRKPSQGSPNHNGVKNKWQLMESINESDSTELMENDPHF